MYFVNMCCCFHAAVDVWSVGVIFLSLLSSKYPFFRASDDMSALAEIVSLLGTKKLQQAATQLGKRLTISENKPTLDLRVLCQRLRRPSNGWSDIPDSAYDLLGKLLDPNPFLRTTAKEALGHPYFA
ncbi:CDC7 [Cordylochernes scorpioides]|uniref:CDC7 n=1 Tax=Cordylochernes scorpioides TaxID=51811 RepID=A0ABY6K3Q0_9ARAC|nr:CDC7 [Cordylochernes scorpioides]